MRINDEIEEYDVMNLDNIYVAVEDLLGRCSNLSESAMIMEQNITVAEDGFETENMERAKDVIKRYIEMLSIAEYELRELAGSANEFAEKLRNAWRPW